MKGTILNQTVDTVVGSAEAALEVVKEVGSEVVGAAGGVLREALKVGADTNITRYS